MACQTGFVRASKPNEELITIFGDHLEATIENYLNALDRLAFCILKGFVPEKDWRAEYRKHIENDITSYEHYFRTDTQYRNIVDLHNKWSRT